MSNFCHPLIMPNFCHQKRTLLLKEFLVIFTFRIVFTRHSVAPDWQKVLVFKITIVLTASCQNHYRFDDLWSFMLSDNISVRLNFWWCTLVWGAMSDGKEGRLKSAFRGVATILPSTPYPPHLCPRHPVLLVFCFEVRGTTEIYGLIFEVWWGLMRSEVKRHWFLCGLVFCGGL